MIGKKNVEEVKQIKFICMRAGMFGIRAYAAGEYLSVPVGTQVPGEFMPLVLVGPEGEVETGPHFFCLKECSRHGRTFKPGELWDKFYFKEKPPEGPLFAPLSDKPLYELFVDSNRVKVYRLKSVGPEVESEPESVEAEA